MLNRDLRIINFLLTRLHIVSQPIGWVEIGFDIIDPIQPECMNVEEVKKKYEKIITLHGTLSLQKTLRFGSKDDVIDEVKQRIENCGFNGGLILAPANTVTDDIPIQNILAVYETVNIRKDNYL